MRSESQANGRRDRSGVLVARIVTRDEDVVGRMRRFAHFRPFLTIPVPSGAEDHDEPSARKLPRRSNGPRERVG